MQTQYQKVREFVQAFGQECPERLEMQSDSTCAMRARLHREESVTEFTTACLEGDLVKVFDSVLDSLYVVLGTAVAFGIAEEMVAKGFAEVHRSNMSKMWNALEIDSEHFLPGYTARMVYSSGDRRYSVTDSSGKIIKPPSYSPANLGPILEGAK